MGDVAKTIDGSSGESHVVDDQGSVQGELIPAGTEQPRGTYPHDSPPELSDPISALISLPALLESDPRVLAKKPLQLPAYFDALERAIDAACDAFQYGECRRGGYLLEASSRYAGSLELEILARELTVRSEYELTQAIPISLGGRGKTRDQSSLCGFTEKQIQKWRERYRGLPRSRLEELFSDARKAKVPVVVRDITDAAKTARRKGSIQDTKWFLQVYDYLAACEAALGDDVDFDAERPALGDVPELEQGMIWLVVESSWVYAARCSGLCLQDWVRSALNARAAS